MASKKPLRENSQFAQFDGAMSVRGVKAEQRTTSPVQAPDVLRTR